MPGEPGEYLDRIRGVVAQVLGIGTDAVPTGVPLRELGVDSAGLTRLAADLSAELGRDVPAWAVWRHPTASALAGFLAGVGEAAAPEPRKRITAEPIAIVGLGCRLPGGIGSPDELWDALLAEFDATGEVPAGRWDAERWYDDDIATPGRTTTRRGAFLDDVAGFDAAFFRFSPAEAERTDPQQRIALEIAWSALEDARIVPDALAGSRTGVFFGTMWQEYHLATGADPASIGPQSAVGWDTSIVPARIAYALGLRGPAMSVGTACSSSLAAVHLAAASLRRGESDLALAGGVSLMLQPHTTVAMTKFGGLNPAGQCRAFDAGAAGYVRGEGCGVVVLRRLSDALRDGDRIYAVVRGSAVNNDGASNGLTAPNPRAQVDVLRDAWRDAGVPAEQVSYVEAHGTGTPLGDVVEAAALGEVFAPGRTGSLLVGSAKTNFGHLEPAAGVLGVLKTALALHHGILPASLHFDEPNPGIDFAGQRIEVVTARRALPPGHRYAGVSGFGFGGTNVHIALEQAPAGPRRLLALSGDSESALRARVDDVLRDPAGESLVAAEGGPHRAFAAADRSGDLTVRTGRPGGRPGVAFCFSGHGSQWIGMGRDLLAEPVFRAAMTEVDRALADVVGWSVIDELVAADSGLNRTGVIQPALFAVQVALARTLSAWGLVPDAVFGQSIGEVAAAVTAGALTLDQGARLIGVWSRLIDERAAGTGTVLVCALSGDDAARRADGRLTVAGWLSGGWTCLSGRHTAIDEIERELAEDGVRTHRVAIDYPSHSADLSELGPELVHRLGELDPAGSAVPFLSTVTGGPLPGGELDAGYWARNMCLPMRLAEVVGTLPAGTRVVEIGPHPVLREQLGPAALATCRRDAPGRHTLEDLLGALWVDGVDVDWAAVTGTGPLRRPVPLLLSARGDAALRAQAGALHAHVTARSTAPADLASSLATTRSAFDHRAVLLVRDGRDVLPGLAAIAAGNPAPGLVTGARAAEVTGPVLVFPGQGSQWAGMACELIGSSPVFAARLGECARALAEFVDWSLTDVLADEAALARADVVQPALWAVMVSLAQLWQAHGVRPAAVVGHSQGEIAAACVAGGLSLRDAAMVVTLRGKVIARELSGIGGMVSVGLSRAEAEQRIPGWDPRLSVAAELGPSSTVLAGGTEELEVLLARCRAEGVRAGRVAIDYPSHSPMVDPVRDEVLDVLAPVRPRSSGTTFVSTVTGEPVDTATLDADYWFRNLRAPVELRAAVTRLIEAGHRVFVEVSPHPVLTPGIQETVGGHDVVVAGTLRRGEGGLDRFLTSVAEAHVRGVAVSWAPALPTARVVDLPTYPFQRRRYWLETGQALPDGSTSPPEAEFWAAVERGDLTTVRSTLDIAEDVTLADLLPALARWRHKLTGGPAEPVEAAEPAVSPDLAATLAAESPERRMELVLDIVLRHTAAILGYGPDDWPTPDRAFRDLGFESVTGVELRNRLSAEIGRPLAVTLVYDEPTPAAMAAYLLAQLGLAPGEPEAPRSIDGVSDDELFQFIDSITSRRAS
ncbi:acyltransferase domain-containing protein [Saccharopolyspora sp. NFXS83]|uniref:type I polyketide synthase n=1 Tax=Saccharopolyspora sp. NFXS83 TaxID=2993560 RepID=UPI00224A9B96|nr:type I polyketide synthase [Saccharopolyspora sp. NFXS83]MCX2731058.1 acyltransferase domain-containing protein [Saccharopolyspora sp. NFXS83]